MRKCYISIIFSIHISCLVSCASRHKPKNVIDMEKPKCPRCGSERYWIHRKFTNIWYECVECGYNSGDEECEKQLLE